MAAPRGPLAWVRGVRHPEAFHGIGVDRGFFEGWYVKLVSEDRAQRWAVIPGVFRGLANDAERDEAFVQVLDGLSGRSWYHRFEVAEFAASDSAFDVAVGPNRFDSSGVTLDLPQLRGRLEYSSPLEPWPVTLREPGIMGWYGLVPFLECFHGIVSFGHGLSGTLEVEGSTRSFHGGRGYIEKDWGKAFPAGYVWLASNHVDADAGASLIASVAIIPWLGRSFRGYIVGFRHGGVLHKWTTYNGSREELLEITDSRVTWRLDGPSGRLELSAERVRGGLLHAPLRTAMHQRVEETLDARVSVRHLSPTGEVLLDGTADCAGLEVFGDTERLLGIAAR
ncbi:tocopherol cyclase family protein [Salinibacterium soli]|uniref:Tocopherol cyclase family protein n=1 Tax=Antiquaquibacter soli TaxID=3064523 RepID=A0ABT9BKT5_9MICO|nr:tocopherol cyclase family protein [Protaetiibacter sp. WY-16]MDO7881631.1 tocopherol cyclase family protein [Protaetiibacter sp. WY-16]